MSIIRRKRKEKSFVQMEKEIFLRNDLSYKAKGLYSHLLALPDDWTIYEKDLVKRSTDTLHSVRQAIAELIDKGYMHRHRVHDERGRISWETSFYEVVEDNPHFPPKCDIPKSVSPKSDSPTLVRDTYTNKEPELMNKGTNKQSNNVASDNAHEKNKKQKQKSKAETVIAEMQKTSKRGNEAWVIQFISEQEKYLSLELLQHLAQLIVDNPNKPQPYFRAIVYENWYKIKPLPQTVEELTRHSTRPTRKESTESYEDINARLFS